jgi:hypothetical protein
MLNQAVLGRTYGPQTFEVDRSKIREFALALGDRDLLETSDSSTGDWIAHPTFSTLLNFWVPKDSLYADLGIDYRYLLHGEQEYEYHAPIRAGMILETRRQCSKIFSKPGKSGVMEFCVIENEIRNRVDGSLLVVGRSTLVLRWPAPEVQHAKV